MRGATPFALTLVLTISACDPPRVAQPTGEATAMAAAATPAPLPTPPAPSAGEARRFILSKLEDVTSGGETLSFTNVDLSGPWRWTETVTSSSSSPGMTTLMNKQTRYVVNPADLRVPVGVHQSKEATWSVKFECAVKNCIRVEGGQDFTSVTILEKEPTTNHFDISDPQSSNFWWVADEETAERVAKAMNVLLRAQGAQESAF